MVQSAELLSVLEQGVAQVMTWLEKANHYGLPVPFVLIVSLIAFRARWQEREKYYLDLLKNLGAWENALSDRLDYYEQPGSEYNDDKITSADGYQVLRKKSTEAASSVRETLPVAKAFLSDNCIKELEDLEKEHWHIAEHGSSCESEYLHQMKPLVRKTYACVLRETKKDLRKSRFNHLLKGLSDK